MPDGFLAAFNLGVAIGMVAILFGAGLRSAESLFNPFNWSHHNDDLWSR